mmetsp:Transcript_24525/g.67898  ORF Transcript_24525/g.67898 Transcript_24525/m.67898 type:complete len:784 (-) Transcript_24525:282-2633(-)
MASPLTPSQAGNSNKEDTIILPPPSATNPFPALGAALRVDQQEQLLELLQHDPATSNTSTAGNGSSFRQMLVFGTPKLRTLLLRQALVDPHERVWKGKKKNWDAASSFPFPNGLNIVGTKVLSWPPEAHDNDTTALLAAELTQATGGQASATLTAEAAAAAVAASSASAPFDDNYWGDAIQMAREGSLDVVTYFLHAQDLDQTKAVIRRIKSSFTFRKGARGGGGGTAIVHHRLVYVPQPTAIVHQLLQQTGLTSQPHISTVSLSLDLFPLENDVFSTEFHSGLRDAVAVEMTPSNFITSTARSLLKLQDITGTIPRVQAYGPLGEEVLRKLMHKSVDEYLASTSSNAGNDPTADEDTPEQKEGLAPVPESGVAALVLMDRRVDWVTPMVTPLTYEGLLDDILGIDSGFLHIPLSIINPPEDQDSNATTVPDLKGGPKKKKGDEQSGDDPVALGVNGSDSLYAEVRNQHVEKFGSFLQNQAMALRASHAEFTAHGKTKDLSEIHQFVKQIPVFAQNLRSLTNHIHLAELVKKNTLDIIFRERWQTERSILEGETCYETLEDLVGSQYPPLRFFRLLCLQSLCAGGIKSSRLDAMKRDVVQTYGYEYLFVLYNLEQAGLLRRREGLWMDSASSFSTLRKQLILIHPEVNTVEPDDVAYVSSGYAPMSVRLIQTAVKGWTGREDILRELPGRALDVYQTNPPQDLAAAMQVTPTQPLGATAAVANLDSNGGSKKKPILAVMYLGGITYMEIAALRFLSNRSGFPYHILILTTEIVNGSTLLQSMK